MKMRVLFGKPLPRALRRAKETTGMSWLSTLTLLAGAGVVTWVVMALLARDAKETEEMVYFWPE